MKTIEKVIRLCTVLISFSVNGSFENKGIFTCFNLVLIRLFVRVSSGTVFLNSSQGTGTGFLFSSDLDPGIQNPDPQFPVPKTFKQYNTKFKHKIFVLTSKSGYIFNTKLSFSFELYIVGNFLDKQLKKMAKSICNKTVYKIYISCPTLLS